MSRSRLTQSNRAGWAMAIPGFGLIAVFIILPFFFAFGLSFTNQRLISPNPTEWVGMDNYRQLLGMGVLTLEPERDDAGAVIRDEDGAIEYPRLREYTRNNPDYPHLDGMREWKSWSWGDNQVVVLARDVDEMQAVARGLEGQLTATLQIEEEDAEATAPLLRTLERKAGRVLGMMPREGFGFSNDAPVNMGPPAFGDAAIEVGARELHQSIRMRYIL